MTEFVLVPGGWLGAWAWRKVVPVLAERGHSAHSVTLTGMGERVHLASEQFGVEVAIQDVLNVLHYEDLKDVVLVGHSFAGKVVAAVADREPERIRMILYLDAFRPAKVRTPQGSFDLDEFGGPLPPGRWTIPFTDEILEKIGKDVKGEDRSWMLSKVTPWPTRLSTDSVALSSNFDRVKSAYIFCTAGSDGEFLDDILKGKWGRLEGPHKVIESGHWPMVTKPHELAEDMILLSY